MIMRGVVGAAAVAVVLAATLGAAGPAPRLLTDGVALDPGTGRPVAVAPGGQGAFVRGSSVLQAEASDPGARAAVRAARRWLAAGTVPGRTPEQRAMAGRALLDLRALTRPDGRVAVAWYGAWRYVWPRDASFVAAAYAVSGHRDDARAVLHALAHLQRPDGTWAARYLLTGTGVPDDRPWQLDADGWVPWAVWLWWRSGGRPPAGLDGLWGTVERAADAAAGSLGPDGLPPAGPDYWESRSGEVTLGTVAPLLAGLRAAAAIAAGTGRSGPSARWSAAAARLQRAVTAGFAPYGYPRTAAASSGADAAVTWLAPPFAAADPQVAAAVRVSAGRLHLPGGGELPGADWPGDRSLAWTPETAMFALAAASSGEWRRAAAGLGWLQRHRTRLGSLPEKVSDQGQPGSVAPLAWTCALVVLAMEAQEHPLPVPPSTR